MANYEPGRVILIFEQGTSENEMHRVTEDHKLKIEKIHPDSNLAMVEVPTGEETSWLLRLMQLPKVSATSLNYRPHAAQS